MKTALTEAKSHYSGDKDRIVMLLTGLALIVASLLAVGCSRYPPLSEQRLQAMEARASLIIRNALVNDDPRIRAKALEVIATTGRLEFMPAAQNLLDDRFVPVRYAAALAVGDLKYAAAKPLVKQLLKDSDQNVRMAAGYALGRLGTPGAFAQVRRAVNSTNQTVRANAIVLLGKIGDRTALKALYRALRADDSDDRTMFQAAEAIAMLGDERIYPKLWTMLISVYADDRVMGVKAMGALGTQEAQSALVTMLDDDMPEVRLAAAEQLGKLGNPAGAGFVKHLFEKNLTAAMEEQTRVRINVLAAMAIGQIKTPELVRFLPQILDNPSMSVRIAAAKAVFQAAVRDETFSREQ